jgi:hypothetical protein
MVAKEETACPAAALAKAEATCLPDVVPTGNEGWATYNSQLRIKN